jgi:hypothetical protein
MVCGVWCVVCGVWCVVCGVWCVVCGVWCVMWCWVMVGGCRLEEEKGQQADTGSPHQARRPAGRWWPVPRLARAGSRDRRASSGGAHTHSCSVCMAGRGQPRPCASTSSGWNLASTPMPGYPSSASSFSPTPSRSSWAGSRPTMLMMLVQPSGITQRRPGRAPPGRPPRPSSSTASTPTRSYGHMTMVIALAAARRAGSAVLMSNPIERGAGPPLSPQVWLQGDPTWQPREYPGGGRRPLAATAPLVSLLPACWCPRVMEFRTAGRAPGDCALHRCPGFPQTHPKRCARQCAAPWGLPLRGGTSAAGFTGTAGAAVCLPGARAQGSCRPTRRRWSPPPRHRARCCGWVVVGVGVGEGQGDGGEGVLWRWARWSGVGRAGWWGRVGSAPARGPALPAQRPCHYTVHT